MSPELPAFAAGALATLAAADALSPVMGRLSGSARGAFEAVEAVARIGREGHPPASPGRVRIRVAAATAAAIFGFVLLGPGPAAVAFLAAPLLVGRAVSFAGERYRRVAVAGIPAVCVAMADALSAGRSIRGALTAAAASAPGPAGVELQRVVAELALGATTDSALRDLRGRIPGPETDALVTATILQARAGGDLETLLRGLARAAEDQARIEDDARTATAQARFTGLIVVLLPFGGAILAELAAPGFVAGLLGQPLTAWLVLLAVALQVTGAVAVRRLGAVRA